MEEFLWHSRIFVKKMWLRGNERCLFRHLCYAYPWNVCLLLKKPKDQEKPSAATGIHIYTAFLHQTLPVNSQVLPVLAHVQLYCRPWRQLLLVSRCRVSLHIHVVKSQFSTGLPSQPTATPSVLFLLKALLPAKTIKANRAEMFKCLMQNFVNSTVYL